MLGYQEMMLTIRCHEKEARVDALVLTSPELAWTEVCFFISQSLLRRRGEIGLDHGIGHLGSMTALEIK